MKNNKSIVISILSIAICIGCLTGFGISYSWIKRNWAPEFYTNQMTIETGGSLAIKLANDTLNRSFESVDLAKDIIGIDNFALKQVSNYSGDDDGFFTIDYSEGDGQEKLVHLVPSGDKIKYAQDKGYIWARFQIQAQEDDGSARTFVRYVFIDSFRSYIRLHNSADEATDDASEAIRCSLTIEGLPNSLDEAETTDRTIVFKKTVYARSTDENPHYHRGALPGSDGMLVYSDFDSKTPNPSASAERHSGVYEFADYNGGFPGYNDEGVPYDQYDVIENKALFKMDQNTSRWVIFRLWLEGYDENTTDAIAGENIDFKLVFRAHENNAGSTN